MPSVDLEVQWAQQDALRYAGAVSHLSVAATLIRTGSQSKALSNMCAAAMVASELRPETFEAYLRAEQAVSRAFRAKFNVDAQLRGPVES